MEKKNTYSGFCTNCEKEVVFERITKPETYTVKGEPVKINVEVSRCAHCCDEVIDSQHNPDPFDQAYREYRKKHNFLQPEEIKEWRNKYGFTQAEAAKLLGLGTATLNRYENGSLQNEAHERLIRLAMEFPNLVGLVENSEGVFSDERKRTILKTIKESADSLGSIDASILLNLKMTDKESVGEHIQPDIKKLYNAILFFTRGGVLKTKLNKLLFYADFRHYKEYAVPITGVSYAHLPHGPAPDNYEMYYALLSRKNYLEFVEEIYPGGLAGEKLVARHDPDLNLFTTSELRVLTSVKEYFEEFSATKIRDYSHQEAGYKETRNGEIIPYSWAREMRE